MNREEIIEKTNHFLVEEFEVNQNVLVADANLKDTLDLDSLDYVDLVVIIESNFGVKLESKDFAGIISFDDLYNTIYSKVQGIS